MPFEAASILRIGVERRWLNRVDERSASERRRLADFKDASAKNRRRQERHW
jgi:hypothetical protein